MDKKLLQPLLKRRVLLLSMVVLIIGLIFCGIILYTIELKNKLYQTAEQTLDEILTQYQFNFDTEMNTEITMLKNVAHAMGYLEDEREYVLRFLNEKVEITAFKYISIVNPDGVGIVNTGNIIDVSDQEYFKRAMQGEVMFSTPGSSVVDQSRVIPVAAPVYRDKEIVGVLIGSYDAEYLNKLLPSTFQGRGYVFVIDQQGMIAFSSDNSKDLVGSNLAQLWEEIKFPKGNSLETIEDDIQMRVKGHAKYKLEGVTFYAHYAPLDYNNWYIVAVVPDEVVTNNASRLLTYTYGLAGVTMAGALLFGLCILFLQRRSEKQSTQYIQALEQVAYYDDLTGIPNMIRFKQEADQVLRDHQDIQFILGKIDIANFKMVNELFDHKIGDMIVINMAKMLLGIRKQMNLTIGTVARITADEFLILDVYHGDQNDIVNRTIAFENAFNEKMQKILGTHRIEFRYGQYILKKGESDITSCIEKANLAHRMAKVKKGDKVYNYDESLRLHAVHETEMENAMETAMENGEFRLYLQPKYSLKDEVVVGAEALVRWQKEGGKLISPGEFIPLFERNGFITKVDMYMLHKTCEKLAEWKRQRRKTVPVSINFSRIHLNNPGFVGEIKSVVDRYGVDHCNIEIELTESIVYDNEAIWEELSRQLHEEGFGLAMDDFGTGYSSLGMLKTLFVDVIKLDKSFFDSSRETERGRILVESVIQMAKKLGIQTVAEGVEIKETVEFLKKAGCDAVQGFYFSKPMEADRMTALLEKGESK